MNILFVCTGNTCRSPMAAALFNKIAVENDLDVRIESAGLFAVDGALASVGAYNAMKKYGIDLSEHRAKNITPKLLEQSDLVLTMTQAHKAQLLPYAPEKVKTMTEFAGISGNIDDPFGGSDKVYEASAEQIWHTLLKVADKIGNN